jgi:Fe-S-cluster-containing hydrogenase component 2
MEKLTDWLACPKCVKIGGNCATSGCLRQCVDACPKKAITESRGKAFIDGAKCDSCLKCVMACPINAIDKADLKQEKSSLVCESCGRIYEIRDGVCMMNVEHEGKAKELFDYYAEGEYESHHGAHLKEDLAWKPKKVLDFLGKSADYPVILDLGCGPGVISRDIAGSTKTRKIIFIDLTPIPLLTQQKERENIFVAADAGWLPLHNGTVDLTLMLDLLEHVPELERVLIEESRVSRNILVKSPLEKSLLRGLLHGTMRLIYGGQYWKRIFGHVQKFNRREMHEHLKTTGFKPLDGFELLSIDFADSIKSPPLRLFHLIQKVSFGILPAPILEALFGGHLWILARNMRMPAGPNK